MCGGLVADCPVEHLRQEHNAHGKNSELQQKHGGFFALLRRVAVRYISASANFGTSCVKAVASGGLGSGAQM